jgi:hypothetical protein
MPDPPKSQDHWFTRLRADGSMATHATRGENGEVLILDNGWVASFADGIWQSGIRFSHERIADFTPIKDQGEADALANEARIALGAIP